MITEQALMPQISVTDPLYKDVCISLCTSILKDGLEIARTCTSKNFQQGQIEEVKIYLNTESSPEIDYLISIWNV